jgi:hypothetical protein
MNISFLMFIFGNFLVQYGTKLVELCIISMTAWRKIQWDHTVQLPTLKIDQTISNFQILFYIDMKFLRLYATGSELEIATLFHTYRPSQDNTTILYATTSYLIHKGLWVSYMEFTDFGHAIAIPIVIGFFDTFLLDRKFKELSNEPLHTRFWHFHLKLWRFLLFLSNEGMLSTTTMVAKSA